VTRISSDLSDLLADYAFDLPEELIAQEPSANREDARLLVVRRNPERGLPRFEDLKVSDLPRLAAEELPGTRWVRNRTRVFPARFYARRPTGGRHEIVLTREKEPGVWEALVRGSAHFQYPQELTTDGEAQVAIRALGPGLIDLRGLPMPMLELLSRIGEMPLPPYIRKRDPRRDRDRYQSVWAREDRSGSVAAPTASLHFTDELCSRMHAAGADFADIVLHVGLGTFAPVRVERLSEHSLHAEPIEVEAEAFARLEEAAGASLEHSRLVPLGTTALRTLESLPLRGEASGPGAELQQGADGAWRGETRLFVRPGFQVRYSKALFTNFHLPESTLFVLVATFCGSRELALEAYRRAVRERYRFFSFGDASIWI
jgi:S-adenosylmethionine:tRNA ribosyltransferase-isomerase